MQGSQESQSWPLTTQHTIPSIVPATLQQGAGGAPDIGRLESSRRVVLWDRRMLVPCRAGTWLELEEVGTCHAMQALPPSSSFKATFLFMFLPTPSPLLPSV